MLLSVLKSVAYTFILCFFISLIVLAKSSASITFTLNIAPIVDLTTFKLYISAEPFETIICFIFKLSAVLSIVPIFPGSWILSNISETCSSNFIVFSLFCGFSITAIIPWGFITSVIVLKTFSAT